VQLVLHAAALGENGAIYVLEMGEQLHVVEMARDLIRLAGLVPGRDIRIDFTGLRPGEKLSEELVGRDEMAERSQTEKILSVRGPQMPLALLACRIASLEQLAQNGRTAQVLSALREMLPSLPADIGRPTGPRQIGTRTTVARPLKAAGMIG
jgi:FlaA1/EpsC-like NDP-sugar epimerase